MFKTGSFGHDVQRLGQMSFGHDVQRLRQMSFGHDVQRLRVDSFGHDVQRLEADMIVMRVMLKIFIGIIQIPLTVLYFTLSLIGGILSGAGWIAGVIVFMITGICWLFGQFDAWYQPVIGFGIALVIAFGPVFATDVSSSLVLKIKGLLHMVA